MVDRWFSKDPHQLLPWYVNGTLNQRERRVVERWLAQESEAATELATWRQIQAAVHDQPRGDPPAAVRRRVMAQAASRQPQRVSWRRTWALGAALSLVVLVLLWAVIRPGIALQWKVEAGPVTAFRIYRAPVGNAEFDLVGELEATPGAQEYSYFDVQPLPLHTYAYRIEAVGSGAGRVEFSRLVTVNAIGALGGQVGIIVTSLLVGFSVAQCMLSRSSAKVREKRSLSSIRS